MMDLVKPMQTMSTSGGLVQLPVSKLKSFYFGGMISESFRHLVITLTGIFWARIELQALRYMPWILLRRSSEPIEHDLDYTDMLPPVAWYQSMRRKHFFVSIAIGVTVLLKIQIILAASLFRLAVVEVEHEADVRVLDSFALLDEIDNGLRSSSIAHVRGLESFNMSLPFGVSDDLAYQTFMAYRDETDAGSRPTLDSPVTAVVDGLSTNTSCLLVDSCTLSLYGPPIQNLTGDTMEIDLNFTECNEPKTILLDLYLLDAKKPNRTQWNFWPHDQDELSCSTLSAESPQILYYALHFGRSASNASEPALNRCAAVLCSANTWISPVEVTDNGINPSVTVRADATREAPFPFSPWLAMESSINGQYFSTSPEILGPIEWYYDKMEKPLEADDMSVYSSDILREALEQELKTYGPMLAHYQLRQDSQDRIIGSRATSTDRLQVNLGVCVAMIVMFTVMAAAALCMCWKSRDENGLYSRDPATILGSLAVMHDDMSYAEKVTQPLTSTKASRKAMWADCTYSPLVLRPWYRALLVLYGLGLMIGLSVTLQKSNENNGLANIDDENSYLPLLYQSLPALAMLGMALYASSSDIAIRGLSAHTSLSVHQRHSSELDRSLLDMLGIRALWFSMVYKLPAISLSQSLAIICGVLPIMSSVLFQSKLVPLSTSIEAEQSSWFGYRLSMADSSQVSSFTERREVVGALGLMRNMSSNFSYPQNTYNDLVFPSFNMNEHIIKDGSSVILTIPAAKLFPTCVELERDDYDAIPRNFTEEQVYFEVNFRQNYTCPDDEHVTLDFWIPLSSTTEKDGWSVFGAVADSPSNVRETHRLCEPSEPFDEAELNPPWRLQTYVWGNFTADAMKFGHISAWKCNYSWIEVPTQVNLLPADGRLQIDHLNPPLSDTTDLRPWEPPFSIPVFETAMTRIGGGDVTPAIDANSDVAGALENRFRLIMQPFGSLTIDAFDDSQRDHELLAALHSDLGFFTAQLANLEHRLGLNETSDTTPAFHDDLPSIKGTTTDHRRYRLIQDATITHIIITILALHIAVNTWALISALVRRVSPSTSGRPWLLDMDLHGVAPPGFSSFSMTEALLERSNVLSFLPDNAHLLPAAMLQKHLEGKMFRLGWFFNTETETPELTVGALDHDGFIFKGREWKDEMAREGLDPTEALTAD